MNEDKALDAIRRLTFDDTLGFDALMDSIIRMANDFKEKYMTLADKHRVASVLNFLLDQDITMATDMRTNKKHEIRKYGIYDDNIMVSASSDIILRQTPYSTMLVDTNTGNLFIIDKIPIEGSNIDGKYNTQLQLIPDTTGKMLLSMEIIGKKEPDKWYLIPNRDMLKVTTTYISINDLNDVAIPMRKVAPLSVDVSNWLGIREQ